MVKKASTIEKKTKSVKAAKAKTIDMSANTKAKAPKAKTAKVEAKAETKPAAKAPKAKVEAVKTPKTKAVKTPKAAPKAKVEAVKTPKTKAVNTPKVETKAAAKAPKAKVATPKAVKAVKAPKAVKAEKALFNEEINYIVARIKRTDKKEVGHYSYLLASTLKYLADMGITHRPCGKHGYIFQVPKKNSAAWRKIEAYKPM